MTNLTQTNDHGESIETNHPWDWLVFWRFMFLALALACTCFFYGFYQS